MTTSIGIWTRLELAVEGILLILVGIWAFRNVKRLRDWRLKRLGDRKDMIADLWRDLLDGKMMIYSWRATSIAAMIIGLILILLSIFGKGTIG